MPARSRQPPGGGGFDEAGDATRRTRLANERTYLAWWRTGLTAFAVSIGSGKLVPALAAGVSWPYTAIGIGFAVLGVVCCGYAFWRHREVEEAISRGEFAHPDERVIALLSSASTGSCPEQVSPRAKDIADRSRSGGGTRAAGGSIGHSRCSCHRHPPASDGVMG